MTNIQSGTYPFIVEKVGACAWRVVKMGTDNKWGLFRTEVEAENEASRLWSRTLSFYQLKQLVRDERKS